MSAPDPTAPSNTKAITAPDVRRKELAEFLRKRREKINPRAYNLTVGERRRASGLLREEVALLAGVSTSWYTALEQGRGINVSELVLRRLATALQMTSVEIAHMLDLVAKSAPSSTWWDIHLAPSVQHFLDGLGPTPAYIYGPRWDRLAWNSSARALFGRFGDWSDRVLPPGSFERNLLWSSLMPQERYDRNLENLAATVAEFRVSYSRHVDDPHFEALIATLSEQSSPFRNFWARHDVKPRAQDRLRFQHPRHGTIDLLHTTMHLAEDPRLTLRVYTAFPGSDAQARLNAVFREGKDDRQQI